VIRRIAPTKLDNTIILSNVAELLQKMFIYKWDVISKRFQGFTIIHCRRTKSSAIQAADKLISERGFSLMELILVMVVTGIISSVLIIPFISGLKQGTTPEIYATATYLAQKKIEEYRSEGYSSSIGSIGTSTGTVTKNGRTYTEQVVTEYVEHSGSSFNTSGTPTEFIRVTVTVSNSDISDVSLWTILAKDFYDPDAN